MSKIKSKQILYISIVIHFALNSALGQIIKSEGCYIKENSKISYRGIPNINVKFKEIDDSALLTKELEKIKIYQKHKTAPIKIEGMVFFNPSTKVDETIWLFKKNRIHLKSLHF